jgi:hypothetical protein
VALHYENLDERTRQFMWSEVDLDMAQGTLYISSRLNEQGKQNYAALLKEAVTSHDDAWLAGELRRRDYMNAYEERKTPRGNFTVAQVPVSAPDTLAEGEFNRFYVRGLCARALQDALPEVEVYRAKTVNQPRPQSEAILGKRISAQALLEDLRKSPGVEPALGLPHGPNSGLTVRLYQK